MSTSLKTDNSQNIRIWDMRQASPTIGRVPMRADPNQQALSALLRAVRQEAGLRQTDLAARLGQPQSYVSKYESGERRLDLLELREICDVVGISLETFVKRLESAMR